MVEWVQAKRCITPIFLDSERGAAAPAWGVHRGLGRLSINPDAFRVRREGSFEREPLGFPFLSIRTNLKTFFHVFKFAEAVEKTFSTASGE